MIRNRLKDYKNVKQHIREFIRRFKDRTSVNDRVMSAKFLKDLHREIESHLVSRGLMLTHGKRFKLYVQRKKKNAKSSKKVA